LIEGGYYHSDDCYGDFSLGYDLDRTKDGVDLMTDHSPETLYPHQLVLSFLIGLVVVAALLTYVPKIHRQMGIDDVTDYKIFVAAIVVGWFVVALLWWFSA